MQIDTTKLANLYLKAKQAYYQGQPILGDPEFDALEQKLRDADPDHPLLSMVGAPVPADSVLTKVKHPIVMGSQNKVNGTDEAVAWCRKHGLTEVHTSEKLDGSSVALYYKAGVLDKAVSRGSGDEGEDITSNAASFIGVPHFLGNSKLNIVVRGEVFLTLANWEKVDKDKSSNPRNMAGGVMGRKDGSDSHLLSFCAFDILPIVAEDQNAASLAWAHSIKTADRKFALLKSMGFETPTSNTVKVDDLAKTLEFAVNTRSGLGYWIDGIVMQNPDLVAQAIAGLDGSNKPRLQVAWKFEAEGTETKLLDVTWQVGATGKLTPVGHLEPCRLGGTTVERVMLNNATWMETLGLRKGCTVTLVKANDIIPYVVEVTESGAGEVLGAPHQCPECSGTVAPKKAGALDLYCENELCSGRKPVMFKRVLTTTGVLGFGDGLIEVAIERGVFTDLISPFLITEPSVFQDLPVSATSNARVGISRAKTLVKELQAVKDRGITVAQLLKMLAVRHLGERRVVLLAQQNPALGTVEFWRDASQDDRLFVALTESGMPGVASEVVDSFATIRDLFLKFIDTVPVRNLGAAAPATGNTTEAKETTTEPQPTMNPKGKVCITGSLPSGKKKAEYKEPLAKAGYELVDDLSKDCVLLIQADPASQSGKSKKAATWGIRVIGEDELVKIVG
jgi:DNA ligase (NAD+)